MSLFNRRKFLILATAPLALSACGFTPIYGDGSAAERMHGRIALGSFSGLPGFQMRERLETRLGQALNATHTLTVSTRVTTKKLAITSGGAITRYNLSGTAKFSVRRNGGDIVFNETITSFTGYNATASAYSTRIAKEDALRRLYVTIADQIVTQMAITAEEWLD